MILYKNHQNQFLIPVFMGMIMVLLNIVPVMSYFNTKTTNTDSLPVVAASKKMEKIATIDKADIGEIEVPVLGGSNNVSVASSSTYVAPASSVCANTPTPGYNQISVCGRIIPISHLSSSSKTDNYSPAAGVAVKWGAYNFIFGHNSYDVFGGIHNLLQVGDPLIVNLDGYEMVYRFDYYAMNSNSIINKDGSIGIDKQFLPRNGSNSMALMTCAPWVINGDYKNGGSPDRFGFVFVK